MINEGTITWSSRNNLGIILSDGVIANAGVIDHSGVNPGESGGSLGLFAYAIANSGTITAAGAEGWDGGEVGLYGYIGVVNRGPIDVSGGDSLAMNGYGGDGGEIGIYGKHIENTADLDLSGGDGDYPGAGGSLEFDAQDVANNSGSINAAAGVGAGLPPYGGWVHLDARNGSVINAGDIDAGGADGGERSSMTVNMWSRYGSVISNGDIDVSGVSTEASDYGADGGEIYFRVSASNANGSIEVSGNLDVSGGDGAEHAGDGGRIYLDKGYDGKEGGIALLGYSDINGDGGDGRYLGDGGDVFVRSYSGGGYWPSVDSFGPEMPGPIVNSADISLRGGDAHADIASSEFVGYGGGGTVVMATHMYGGGLALGAAVVADSSATVTNNGDIDVSGGTAINAGSSFTSDGGWIELEGATGVSNSGKLTANGGDDIGDTESASYGGSGGGVKVYAGEGDYSAMNSGAIEVNGGDGTYIGGGGGWASVDGWGSVDNSGDIHADGGNASTSIEVSFGGDGGEIEVVHVLEGEDNFSNTGTLSAKAGTGVTPGEDGVITEGVTTH